MKQVILMRTDLGMSTGKMCAQAAHACLKPNAATVVLKVSSMKELYALIMEARKEDLLAEIVIDAGNTEVPPGTSTCGSIYGNDAAVNKITGALPLL